MFLSAAARKLLQEQLLRHRRRVRQPVCARGLRGGGPRRSVGQVQPPAGQARGAHRAGVARWLSGAQDRGQDQGGTTIYIILWSFLL